MILLVLSTVTVQSVFVHPSAIEGGSLPTEGEWGIFVLFGIMLAITA